MRRPTFFLLAGGSAALFMPFGIDGLLFLAPFSIVCTLIVLLPFLATGSGVTNRPIWLLGTVAITSGFLVRSLGVQLNSSWREFFYSEDLPSGQALLFVATAVGLMTVGYLVGYRAQLLRFRETAVGALGTSLRSGRFAAGLVVLGIGIVSVGLFVSQTGGLSVENFSSKRGVFLDLESGAGAGSLVILRSLTELPLTFAILMIGAGARFGGNDVIMSKLGSAVFGLLAVVGLAVPFIASQREVMVAFFILGAIVIIRRGGFSMWRLVAGSIVVILLFGLVSDLRHSSADSVTNTTVVSVAESGIDGLFRNRNLADLSKTVRVVDAVGAQLEIDNGARQFGSILGIIPRSVWPSKPVIGTGPEVSETLYGNSRSGIPPGLIAESYWSLAWGGLLICFILGSLAGVGDRALGSIQDPLAYAAWLMILGPLLLDALGVGLGYAVTGLVVRGVQVWLCVLVVRIFSPATRAVHLRTLSDSQLV